MDTKPTTASAAPPEGVVSEIMKEGFETMAIQTTLGLGVGLMAGLVLARGGAGGSARKMITGLGGGIGLGSAWTRCSIQLEEALGTTPKK
jgi:Domain of unknown function (DUF543)